MIKSIFKASKSDAQLAKFLGKVREYAQVYALARRRQKGCDGMGELAMLKEEFQDSLQELIRDCRVGHYLPDEPHLDIDLLADELMRITVD
jgi:hypothetical protein